MAIGKKTGGRQKGTPNKKPKEDFTAALEAAGFNPQAAAVLVAQDRAPCTRCDDGRMPLVNALMYRGVTDPERLELAAQAEGTVPCPLCMGSTYRILGDGEQWKALNRILDSVTAKLSAIQLTGDDEGSPVLVVLHHEADAAKRAVTEKLLAFAQAQADADDA